jgi:hypothetical protein
LPGYINTSFGETMRESDLLSAKEINDNMKINGRELNENDIYASHYYQAITESEAYNNVNAFKNRLFSFFFKTTMIISFDLHYLLRIPSHVS